MAETQAITKKKKFVADGVFNAEIHELLAKFLSKAGYSGCIVKAITNKIIITSKVVNKAEALGKNGVRGNELEALIEKRFGFKKGFIEVKFEVIKNKALSAAVQVEFLKAKLLQGAPTRSAAMFIIRNVMRVSGVKGCEIVVSGKLRQQRAKTVKYKQGYQISTGQPKKDSIDVGMRHVFFKMGIMGIKVKIMLPTDFTGKIGGIAKYLPDKIIIHEPKNHDEQKEEERPERQERQDRHERTDRNDRTSERRIRNN